MSDAIRIRYSTVPFPPYSYVPRSGTPHPVSDPRGHMFGMKPAIPAPLDPLHWHDSKTYLYAVDLFNHGFYWEAHEAWESLWHAAGHKGVMADFLKGLIKLAAAGVKHRESNGLGVARHLKRAKELLGTVSRQHYCGIDVAKLTEQILELDPKFEQNFLIRLVSEKREIHHE